MKRDDPVLAGPAVRGDTAVVARTPMYFGADGGLFGWYHEAPAAAPRDGVAVLCAPFGPEYTRAHRALRHLADRLARHGIATLRFDYHAVGDSAGSEADAGLFERWRASVVEAANAARRASGRTRLCLVGLRLGGTVAALAAAEAGAEAIATWNAVVKGRSYARELQAMALTAKDAPTETGDGLESAGFRIHAETLAAVRAVDLDAATIPAGTRVMHWKREDLPGWDGLLADHQFTVVPDAALEAIAAWVEAQLPPRDPAPATASEPRTSLELDGVRETLCRFGEDGHLFGILARPTIASGRTAILLLNAGSIHHVGPHRLYVRLARELAALGHPALRFDLEGIGDSVLRRPGRENHPYSPTAMRDVDAALAFLRREHGCTRFVVLGICSGAYNTFQAGLALDDPGIARLVMVNPWYFHWHEGLSLDTTIDSHYEDV
ncbi:MAG: serine aminopeptidase domain-containing protein, partial [Gemmatimonadaceae bacterium]